MKGVSSGSPPGAGSALGDIPPLSAGLGSMTQSKNLRLASGDLFRTSDLHNCTFNLTDNFWSNEVGMDHSLLAFGVCYTICYTGEA